MTSVRKQAGQAIDRDEEPSTVIIDSQSIETSPVRGTERGFERREKSGATNGISWLTRRASL